MRTERLRALGAALALAIGLASLSFVLLRRFYHLSLVRALRRQPLLFPALTKAIGQIRHDVLKHRVAVLDLLADPDTSRADVARALLEPAPTSMEVAHIYEQLCKEAQALGLRLRPLRHEPVFGPLVADLRHAEALLQGPDDDAATPCLRAIDARLRGKHADRLQQLSRSGPQTHLHAGMVARWIDSVAGELNEHGLCLAPPGLYLQEAQTAFPLPEATLLSIFGNLLRNAFSAVAQQSNPAIEVRVEQGRDSTGRRIVSLLVRDSSSGLLDSDAIQTRPADRGLGIVREATRTWGGTMVIRCETAPFCKAVGVSFPAPTELLS